MYRNTEFITISQNMVAHGGSFVKNIGRAIMSADPINRDKLATAFPEYFNQYLKM